MATKTFTVPHAAQRILDREAYLLSEMSKCSREAFEAEKHRRLEAARDGSAAPEAIKHLAEVNKLEKEMHETREALYHALHGLRESGYPTLRDEVLKPILIKRQERREQLDKDVQDLRKKYPGLEVEYDRSFDSGSLSVLRDYCTRNDIVSGHMSLADMVAGYSI